MVKGMYIRTFASILAMLTVVISCKTTGNIDRVAASTGALTVGQMAPDFTLKNQDQMKVRLSDYRGIKNVVLVFFPMAFTPV